MATHIGKNFTPPDIRGKVTGAAKYAWLNGIISVAVGERLENEVIITVYEVT